MGKLLERLKTDARCYVFSTAFFLVRAASIPISFAYAGYNFFAGNQTKIKFPDQIKVPKKTKWIEIDLKKSKGRVPSDHTIEIVGGEKDESLLYVGYNVIHVNGKGIRILAESTAYFSRDVEGVSGAHGYKSFVIFPQEKNSILGLERKVDINCDNVENIGGLKDIAYRAALSIASQIGDYSILPVVDKSSNKRYERLEIK